MGEQLDYSFQHYGDFGWSFLFLVPLLIIVVLVLYVIIYSQVQHRTAIPSAGVA